jgi:tripartite-type tricarboxylate transporter receptor subunit TctC
VPLFMTPIPPANQHIRSGALRPLAVTTGDRSRHVPGVQSFAQQGFEGFEAPTWWALLGRAGTPEPVLRRMSEAVSATLNAPEVRARIEEQGADVVAAGPDETRRFLEAEVEKWGRVVRENNITVAS